MAHHRARPRHRGPEPDPCGQTVCIAVGADEMHRFAKGRCAAHPVTQRAAKGRTSLACGKPHAEIRAGQGFRCDFEDIDELAIAGAGPGLRIFWWRDSCAPKQCCRFPAQFFDEAGKFAQHAAMNGVKGMFHGLGARPVRMHDRRPAQNPDLPPVTAADCPEWSSPKGWPRR